MWVIRAKGESYYVDHVESTLPWSTKEAPDNTHTKGSLKFKNALLRVNEDNEATLTELTIYDKFRLRNQKLGITRIMFSPNGDEYEVHMNRSNMLNYSTQEATYYVCRKK